VLEGVALLHPTHGGFVFLGATGSGKVNENRPANKGQDHEPDPPLGSFKSVAKAHATNDPGNKIGGRKK
jgi:hypothetical protein